AWTGLAAPFLMHDGTPRTVFGTTLPEKEFPWASQPMPVLPPPPPATDGTPTAHKMNFATGPIGIILSIQGQEIQRLLLPASTIASLPVPRLHEKDFDLALSSDYDTLISQRFTLLADTSGLSQPGSPMLRLIQNGDTVRSMELMAPLGAFTQPDPRPLLMRPDVSSHHYSPAVDPSSFAVHSLRSGNESSPYQFHHDDLGHDNSSPAENPPNLTKREFTAQTATPLERPLFETGAPPPIDATGPSIPGTPAGAIARADVANAWIPSNLRFGDWETGPGTLEDGPYISRADTLNPLTRQAERLGMVQVGGVFSRGGDAVMDTKGTGFAPYRSNNTAIQFGALTPWTWGHPSNASSNKLLDPEPWRTLLFCPNPASRTSSSGFVPTQLDHPGFANPPDHLWLEYFWTPVVEPRLLSPAFSTQGKINLNFQIFPYTWLDRSTALYAAMKGVRIPAIPWNARDQYKSLGSQPAEYYYEVDVKETLRAFRGIFDQGNVFRYPSEICDIYLVPKRQPARVTEYDRNLPTPPLDPSAALLPGINEWWNGDPSDPLKLDAFELTGDNLREAPYEQLYPRLCTRSNVFRVHYRVQLLRKSRAITAFEWDEAKERVSAERRGSIVIERYLDPNDPNIPDLVTNNSNGLALDEFYRYRVVSHEPFTP
ncbi:MAG: Verru_Chthon cassette protein A, partial [Verrucomicrobiales bacterium]|nr:Verru_Chthon cassette protein A [Verrucomicrobiales bacterium]